MTKDRWLEIKTKIKNDFIILEENAETLEDPRIERETLQFQTPAGKFKLAFIKRPKVLERKTQYSNRIGGDVMVNYVYDENEFTYSLEAGKWDEAADDWQKINADNFA